MKTGDTVRLIQPEIRGPVLKRQVVNDELQALVEYPDADGATQRTWFPVERLELVEAAPQEPAQ